MKKIDVPDKETLCVLYLDEKKSLSQIATIFGASSMTVRSWLIGLDIPIRCSNINLYTELRNKEMSDIQRSVVVGSLLGDGGIRLPIRAVNAHFYERHSEDQFDYLCWKREVLSPFVQRGLYKELGGEHTISGVACNTQDSYKLVTIAHPTITAFWNTFYEGNGIKVIPNNIYDIFNIMSLVVWFCDDGCLHQSNRSVRFHIHTESFSLDEQHILVSLLGKYFSGRIKINTRKYPSGIKYYLTLSGRKYIEKLFNDVIHLVPKSMLYKFTINPQRLYALPRQTGDDIV